DSRSRSSYGTPQVSLLGASSTGWSNDKLALSVERSPLEKDRHHRRPIATVSPSTAITYPTPNVPARSQSPASTVAWTRTSRRIPGGLSATRSGLRVSAAHRPATQSSGDRQNNTVSIPPLGIL